MKFSAKVYEPMYEFNDKKYIRFILSDACADSIQRIHTSRSHLVTGSSVDDSLDGNVLKVKVPFRYRRVMCVIEGRPIQSLTRNEDVEVEVAFKGVWNVGTHSGFSWVLTRLKF